MHNFEVQSDKKATFKIDTSIYSADVICKVSYWLSEHFLVSQEKAEQNICFIIEAKRDYTTKEWESVKEYISQLCLDYQMREVVHRETKDIRTILYLKAFTNIREILEDHDE